MADDIVLEYKRVDGDRCHGRIYQGDRTFVSFYSEDFKSMLREFASALQQDDAARAVWKRTDRSGLAPYYLDAEVTELFRKDPVAAIESMCPPSHSPMTTVQRVQEQRVKMVPISVRAGHDALADAFGEELYVRTRERKGESHIECPCCGIWAPLIVVPSREGLYTLCRNTRCFVRGHAVSAKVVNTKWATVKIEELLKTESPRFYLPRSWNEGRSWVSLVDLQSRWDEFNKEKESCR